MNSIYKVLENRSLGTLNALELSRVLEYSTDDFLSSSDKILLRKAVDVATILHSKQTRKNRDSFTRTPYIEHPLRNTIRLVRWGVIDINVLIASLLHDVVEDSSDIYCTKFLHKSMPDVNIAQEFLLDDIGDTFGSIVKSIVIDVTNDSSWSDISDRDTRNKLYYEHVMRVIHNNPMTFLVKLSDFIDNATGLAHNLDESFIKRNSMKYEPVIAVFENELLNLITKQSLSLPKAAIQDIRFKLTYTRKEFQAILV